MFTCDFMLKWLLRKGSTGIRIVAMDSRQPATVEAEKDNTEIVATTITTGRKVVYFTF